MSVELHGPCREFGGRMCNKIRTPTFGRRDCIAPGAGRAGHARRVRRRHVSRVVARVEDVRDGNARESGGRQQGVGRGLHRAAFGVAAEHDVKLSVESEVAREPERKVLDLVGDDARPDACGPERLKHGGDAFEGTGSVMWAA